MIRGRTSLDEGFLSGPRPRSEPLDAIKGASGYLKMEISRGSCKVKVAIYPCSLCLDIGPPIPHT